VGAAQSRSVLFELLNQMDGLGEDIDIVFVLRANRPEVIEPPLASRPGRIDLAIEMPLPDQDGRSRPLDLYGKGLRFSDHGQRPTERDR
jgi:cell division protease FtsH